MKPVLILLGPTASGKTAWAIRQAQARGGEVVNMDSMQVYRDLSVLTARPDAAEMQGVPHHLFGHVDADTVHSAGAWADEAMAVIGAIQARGGQPILAGGTGLYSQALTEGLAPTPPVPAEVRAATRRLVAQDVRAAHARLGVVDPVAAARIERKDAARIARALEVVEATGRPLSAWQADPQPPLLAPGSWEGLVLAPDREVLYARIEARFHAMMETGGLEEAQRLWRRGLPEDRPCLKAHGMPGLIDHFEGRCDLEAAIARAILDTRHYAKRQLTWIRNRTPGWRPAEG